MWTQTDFSFKKFLSKRVTSNIKKGYEEFGDVAIDVHATEVKYDEIPFDNPAAAVTAGVATLHTLLALTLDNSVLNNQSWFAATGPTRLKNWLSDKYGALYTIKLYDNSNNEIYPTDAIDWLFDYTTGVLIINGNAGAYAQPFKITGYRYTGQYLSDVTLGSGGGGHIVMYNGVPLTQRTKLNFLGTVLAIGDDSLNDQTTVSLLAIASQDVSYVPTIPGNWSFTTAPTNAKEAFDSLAAYLALTAPAKALVLTGQNLAFAGQTLYSGKLAAGLAVAWYSLFPAGTTVNTVIYSAAFTLSSIGFRCGSAGTPATYGSITATVNAVDVNTYVMTAGPGSNGIIAASNFGVFNSIWEKADGTITANQTAEGAASYVMKHTEAGISNAFTVHRDDNVTAPSFTAGLVMSVNTLVAKWLSGVSYLGFGTVLNLSFNIANAFRKVYMTTGVAVVSCPGLVSMNFDPVSVPNFANNFVVSSTATLDIPNVSSLVPIASVVARKPNNLSAATSNYNLTLISNGISTYGTVSTTVAELFQDEAQRLNTVALTAFVSTAVLATSEAQVIPGAVKWKAGGDADQFFTRRFIKATANNGNIVIGGVTLSTQVAPFGTGNLNVLLRLETEALWFDLGRPFGSDNGTGDGSTPANSIGARASFVAGGFGFSFGTYSTANNSDRYLFRAILRTGAPNLTSITTS